MGHGLDLDQLHPPQTRPIAIPDREGYVDFVSTTCVNMCQVKPLESFKGGYHPIIPHHNHFSSMLARNVNHYKLLAN